MIWRAPRGPPGEDSCGADRAPCLGLPAERPVRSGSVTVDVCPADRSQMDGRSARTACGVIGRPPTSNDSGLPMTLYSTAWWGRHASASSAADRCQTCTLAGGVRTHVQHRATAAAINRRRVANGWLGARPTMAHLTPCATLALHA
ncbi:MAG: hypothetical protein GFH27_549301n143 [Chloroflexi bacterium AL-W]|nr:hypothetical protein [Chloroflexi bacterium AL-N1]NOK68336.1 hypothetical protein [Chloroflexi bacterium AL-N10]NOK73982.1 hypothetical protein [Chloroflexi bacterium AL-N5]NOK82950.1 hypothetical protein [Chloroflexi bacterium AL-W]